MIYQLFFIEEEIRKESFLFAIFTCCQCSLTCVVIDSRSSLSGEEQSHPSVSDPTWLLHPSIRLSKKIMFASCHPKTVTTIIFFFSFASNFLYFCPWITNTKLHIWYPATSTLPHQLVFHSFLLLFNKKSCSMCSKRKKYNCVPINNLLTSFYNGILFDCILSGAHTIQIKTRKSRM